MLSGTVSEYEDDDDFNDMTASVEMLQRKSFEDEENTFKVLPELSYGHIN